MGGIDEIATSLAVGVVDLLRFLAGGPPAPFLAEGHGAEGELANSEPAVS